MNIPDWDSYFMTMVYLVATRSKDENTHVGAVIVGPNNEVRSVGYNSFPRGLNDNIKERQERPLKYSFIEHSERNAVYNATLFGVSLECCKMYTNGIPCVDCARSVIQSGIKEVIVDKKWDAANVDKWAESAKISLVMFNECGVKVRYWDGELLSVVKFRRGEIIG